MQKTQLLLTILLLSVLAATPAVAQSSAHYRLEQGVFNAAGHPAQGVTLESASYRISLDSLAEDVVAVGLASASYQVDSGWAPAYRPPGLVEGLRFVSAETLEWEPVSGADSYNLYRSKLIYVTDYGLCFEDNVTSTTTSDPEPPPDGGCFFYLVTAENSLNEEGSKGSTSDGEQRLGLTCP